ncbi:MAG TPA: hypothetical protein VG676_05875, partial [Chitinophagaceae bacterium]|nr:hypothetical protein [Chitinophagaceae bacterium]
LRSSQVALSVAEALCPKYIIYFFTGCEKEVRLKNRKKHKLTKERVTSILQNRNKYFPEKNIASFLKYQRSQLQL